MRIAINTIPLLSPLTGVGKYIYHIARSLQAIDPVNDYTHFYGFYLKTLLSYNENSSVLSHVLRSAALLNGSIKNIPGGGYIPRRLQGMVNKISRKNFDLYFEPNFIPINIKSHRTVVTIFDFSFMLYPEWHPQERINYFEKNFWKKIKRADRIITISDYIRKESISFGLPQEKLRAIHLGFDGAIFKSYLPQDLQSIRKKYGLPPHFMLFVGSIEPRKNLVNMIRAYVSLDKGIRKDIKLVLAGFKGWQNREIMELLKKVKSDVLYLGYLPDKELGELYNLATLFVYPSLYEGFGLPPLEAMACGCPVVVSNVASLPEVCGDAAQYVDPHDVDSIAEGIAKVLGDETLRKSLIARGSERSRLFSWERSANEHLKVFEEVSN